MTNKVYQIVSEKIIAALESGTPPWHKPWKAGIPRNATSNRPYSGINALLLGTAPYSDPRWLTMKQAKQKGGRIRKGEKSTLVIFWKQNTITPGKRRRRDNRETDTPTEVLPGLECRTVRRSRLASP
ncbi:MAG TPA: ArdC family protein [Dehalococcoidia bacterium]|jgi:antirestriction protein ArdC|nr:ArdC family protein [Dehalococcoidia bacterium]